MIRPNSIYHRMLSKSYKNSQRDANLHAWLTGASSGATNDKNSHHPNDEKVLIELAFLIGESLKRVRSRRGSLVSGSEIRGFLKEIHDQMTAFRSVMKTGKNNQRIEALEEAIITLEDFYYNKSNNELSFQFIVMNDLSWKVLIETFEGLAKLFDQNLIAIAYDDYRESARYLQSEYYNKIKYEKLTSVNEKNNVDQKNYERRLAQYQREYAEWLKKERSALAVFYRDHMGESPRIPLTKPAPVQPKKPKWEKPETDAKLRQEANEWANNLLKDKGVSIGDVNSSALAQISRSAQYVKRLDVKGTVFRASLYKSDSWVDTLAFGQEILKFISGKNLGDDITIGELGFDSDAVEEGSIFDIADIDENMTIDEFIDAIRAARQSELLARKRELEDEKFYYIGDQKFSVDDAKPEVQAELQAELDNLTDQLGPSEDYESEEPDHNDYLTTDIVETEVIAPGHYALIDWKFFIDEADEAGESQSNVEIFIRDHENLIEDIEKIIKAIENVISDLQKIKVQISDLADEAEGYRANTAQVVKELTEYFAASTKSAISIPLIRSRDLLPSDLTLCVFKIKSFKANSDDGTNSVELDSFYLGNKDEKREFLLLIDTGGPFDDDEQFEDLIDALDFAHEDLEKDGQYLNSDTSLFGSKISDSSFRSKSDNLDESENRYRKKKEVWQKFRELWQAHADEVIIEQNQIEKWKKDYQDFIDDVIEVYEGLINENGENISSLLLNSAGGAAGYDNHEIKDQFEESINNVASAIAVIRDFEDQNWDEPSVLHQIFVEPDNDNINLPTGYVLIRESLSAISSSISEIIKALREQKEVLSNLVDFITTNNTPQKWGGTETVLPNTPEGRFAFEYYDPDNRIESLEKFLSESDSVVMTGLPNVKAIPHLFPEIYPSVRMKSLIKTAYFRDMLILPLKREIQLIKERSAYDYEVF